FGTEELRWCHADDGERLALDAQRCADGAGSAAEVPLPERVTDDGHGAVRPAAPQIIGGRKCPPSCRTNAEHVKKLTAHQQPLHGVDFAALRQIEPDHRPRERTVEQVAPLAQVIPDRVAPLTSGDWTGDESGQAIWLEHRKWPENH